MSFIPTAAEVLGIIVCALVCVILYQFLGVEHIRRVMHTAVRKSESDKNDYCRIPRNQVIEMMGWQKIYELRPAGYEFKSKPDWRHPSTLMPARRRKLGN